MDVAPFAKSPSFASSASSDDDDDDSEDNSECDNDDVSKKWGLEKPQKR